ncbi:MAG: uncharacterized protein KVP18_001640 [Porospora cf. gigantea A]|nr:MAG: hypothetical protein KVP18_001640 [Porospora cf. gigantea A]
MAIATATESITLAPQESAAYIVPILSTICSHEILSNAQFKQVWSSMISAGRKVEKWKLGGTDMIGRGCIETGRKDSITELSIHPPKEPVEKTKAQTSFAPLKDNEATLESSLTPVADNGVLALSHMFSSQAPLDVFKSETRGMMAFDDIMRLPVCVDTPKAASPSNDPFADLF